jgi:hypothetical protein
LQTLISNQINKECRRLKCTRYFITKGKPFEELFKRLKKKTFRPAKPKIDNFFTSLKDYKRSVSKQNPLCLYYLDETVNHVMSPTVYFITKGKPFEELFKRLKKKPSGQQNPK